MHNELLNKKIEELNQLEDDCIELTAVLSKLNMITDIINKLIDVNYLDKDKISKLYGDIANSYLIASKKVEEQHKFSLAFSSNYWKMLETQTSPVQNITNDEPILENSKLKSEKDIIKGLITRINSAKKKIKITCGEAGFLQRSPELVESIIASRNRGVDVSIYYLDIQDILTINKLNKNRCKMISGVNYSKLHYMIIDDFAYVHTHERNKDTFIYNNENKLRTLKQDFHQLANGVRGPAQKSNSDDPNGVVYADNDLISLLIDEIKSAQSEIYITCGLGILLRKDHRLVTAIGEACKRGIETNLYYVYIPDEIVDQLKQCGCAAKKGRIYPRLHYWIIDNFIYESTHPRKNDQFYYNDTTKLQELERNFEDLTKSAS